MTPEKLLEFGLSIIPCHVGTGTGKDKTPMYDWKVFQSELATPETLEWWLSRHRDCNWAIVTGKVSGVVVLDVDSEEGEAWLASRDIPPTVQVKTAKGRHIYFRHPGFPAKNFAKKIPGCDFRGDGGYVMAPGSIHPDGSLYEWIDSIEDLELADVPLWLMPFISGDEPQAPTIETPPALPPGDAGDPAPQFHQSYVDAAITGELKRVANAPEGQRNDALNTAAFSIGTLLQSGQVDQAAVDTLESVALDKGLDPKEVRATLKSGLEAGLKKPRKPKAPKLLEVATNGAPSNGHPKAPEPAADAAPGFTLDDVGNGARFADRYDGEILYDHTQGRWLIYDDTRYAVDDRAQIVERAELLTWEMSQGGAGGSESLLKWSVRSRSRDRLRAMIEGAKSKPNIAVIHEELDADPWLL